ncbi:protein PLASTID MOVEMENT IMPAIRED 2-like [Canna indica]|uniref:Protein PLASTID MOVEMENT IMPAIRED 2-like n=1 Tax=Canna indica TaxID=4628 RepID=A0AAQ3Q4U3_9LILI|nr:protein PLASTID MOVEMENT IMPAIRED 2-like [Canna indica]
MAAAQPESRFADRSSSWKKLERAHESESFSTVKSKNEKASVITYQYKVDHQFNEVTQELGEMKHELSQLKLRMASASEEKLNAEEEAEASGSKAMQLLQSLEEMRKQIDESDEEHVLVELARIEAEKEYREIEARRAAEAAEFAERIQASKKTINDLNQEIARHAELQMQLDVTNLVINELQKEVDSVRADGDKLGGNDAKEQEESSWHRSLLEAAIDELAKAKEVLASVKEEGFQFMNSMDRIREELVHIAGESSKLKKLEKKAESSSAQLKSKLLKAKTKLETMRTADERTTTIASNLSASILQLETEAQSAKKEKELISEENDSIKTEVAKLEMEISSAEEKLQAVAQVLRAAKASESVALKKLKKESKKATKTRAALIPFSSTMTISKSEYGYLRKEAAKAQMVADKKVAAVRAWSEAVTDREKKALRKAELVEKEIREMRAVERRETAKIEKHEVKEEDASVVTCGWKCAFAIDCYQEEECDAKFG